MTSGEIRIVVVTDDAVMNRKEEETVFQVFPDADIDTEYCPEHEPAAEVLAEKICKPEPTTGKPEPRIVVIGSKLCQVWAYNLGQELHKNYPKVNIIFNLPGLANTQDLAIVEIMRRAGEIGVIALNLTELKRLLKEF